MKEFDYVSISGYVRGDLKASSNYHAEYSLILYFLQHYNFRISEVLRLDKSCLLDDYFIRFQISKSNQIQPIRDVDAWRRCQELFSVLPFGKFSFDYKFFYRQMIKNNPELIVMTKRKNRAVTHSFRYVKAKKLKSSNQDAKTIQAFLHHKSKESQKSYLK